MSGDETTSTAETKAADKAAKAAADRSDAVDQVINSWFGGAMSNSPVSQSQPAYNHVLQSLPALRDAILKLGD